MGVPEGKWVVGKYLIKEVIGKGFYGEVRKAVHLDKNLECAVKIFDLRRRQENDLLNVVKNEVFVLRILKHENIVKVYEHIREGATSYMFMDLAPGKDLVADIMDSNMVFTEDRFRTIFSTVVRTVIYLHNRGIYHGDLKPENVIVDPSGVVTLVDFGASQRRGSEVNPRSGKLAGTPHYLPPECLEKDDWLLAKVDTWALGVMLYVCVCGCHPFTGEDRAEVFASVARGNIEYPDHLSPSVVDLLQRILARNPEERIGLEEILQHRWFEEPWEILYGAGVSNQEGVSEYASSILSPRISTQDSLRTDTMETMDGVDDERAPRCFPLLEPAIQPAVSAPKSNPAPVSTPKPLRASNLHVAIVEKQTSDLEASRVRAARKVATGGLLEPVRRSASPRGASMQAAARADGARSPRCNMCEPLTEASFGKQPHGQFPPNSFDPARAPAFLSKLMMEELTVKPHIKKETTA